MPYVWQRDLANVLRAAGLRVVEVKGWKNAGRVHPDGQPALTFPFNPHAIVMHHDASAKGPTPGEPAYIQHGRPPSDPGPLSQLWLSYDGTWYVIAAGRANHAGLGFTTGTIDRDQGNRDAIGVEWDHTTGEAVPPATYASMVTGLAALLKMLGAHPAGGLVGHLEYARPKGRKNDPDAKAVPMDRLRADVTKAMGHPAPPPPTPEDDMTPEQLDALATKTAAAVWAARLPNELTADPGDTTNYATTMRTLRRQSAAILVLASKSAAEIGAAVVAAMPAHGNLDADAVASAVLDQLGVKLTPDPGA